MSIPAQAADQKDIAENSEVLSIGSRREVLWDDALVDNQKTTATLKMHNPQARVVVLEHDAPWEGDVASFAGIPVTMEITMSDADIYSFKFE